MRLVALATRLRPRMRPLSRLAALSALLLNACYPPGDGKAPPLDEIYFPTGMELSGLPAPELAASEPRPAKLPAASDFLYVVNSDFDLQYRSASVISYDLKVLSDLIPKTCITDEDCEAVGKACDSPNSTSLPPPTADRVPSYYCVARPESGAAEDIAPCGDLGERDEADKVLYPGRCNSLEPNATQDNGNVLKVGTVGIGAFATDAILRCESRGTDGKCDGKSRLFIPVRGDSTLHWIDALPDGTFFCNQGGDDDTCDEGHRSGDTPADNIDHLKQPPEPFALDASADGRFVVLTSQTTGSVSLFANDWQQESVKLVSIVNGLPLAPVGIAAIPEPTFPLTTQKEEPGFLVTYRSAAQIDLLRVHETPPPDNGESYTRYSIRRGGTVPINANSLGFDSRGIAIDDSQRRADYKSCLGDAVSCETAADPAQCAICLKNVRQPDVYVASRAPASMLVGTLGTDFNYVSGTNELPAFYDSIALTFGPSRVVLGKVRVRGNDYMDSDNRPYSLETRVFVVCFDSRRIFIYDPKRGSVEAIVSTGRGPHALAIDDARGLAYLGHFTDSYLGVISLDQRFPQSYAAIIASIGTPKAPRSSK